MTYIKNVRNYKPCETSHCDIIWLVEDVAHYTSVLKGENASGTITVPNTETVAKYLAMNSFIL